MRSFIALIALAVVVTTEILAAPVPVSPTRETFQLQNGLSVTLIPKPGVPMVNMVLAVGIGSANETEDDNGAVHLLEHLVFSGGTSSMDADELILLCRRHGCQFNAHTDRERMTLEASLPREAAEFGLRLLREKLAFPRLGPGGLEAEKAILTEELDQIEDDPVSVGTSLVFDRLFSNHPYRLPVYGRRENIARATLDSLKILHRRHFLAGNCALAVSGEFDGPRIKSKIRDLFETLPAGPAPSGPPAVHPGSLGKTTTHTHTMESNSAHLILGFLAPPRGHEDRDAVLLLTRILGQGNQPLLGRFVSGRRPPAEGFSARYVALSAGGAVLIHLRSKPEKVDTLRREVIQFLGRLHTFRYSKEDFLARDRPRVTDFLEAAVNELRMDMALARERGMDLAMNRVRQVLPPPPPPARNAAHDPLEGVRSRDLRRVAADYLAGHHAVIVTILPPQE